MGFEWCFLWRKRWGDEVWKLIWPSKELMVGVFSQTMDIEFFKFWDSLFQLENWEHVVAKKALSLILGTLMNWKLKCSSRSPRQEDLTMALISCLFFPEEHYLPLQFGFGCQQFLRIWCLKSPRVDMIMINSLQITTLLWKFSFWENS